MLAVLVFVASCGAKSDLRSIQIAQTRVINNIGDTGQFQAIGTYHHSNQSTSQADITSQVTWNSDNPAAVTMAAGGSATALANGSSRITASMGTITSNGIVLTVPSGILPRLTVAPSGVGAPTSVVTSTPAGIACGATCTNNFPAGTSVTLTAAPGAGNTFAGWSTNCQPTNNVTCTIVLNSDQVVSVIFN
jgi:hypothetical protein